MKPAKLNEIGNTKRSLKQTCLNSKYTLGLTRLKSSQPQRWLKSQWPGTGSCTEIM